MPQWLSVLAALGEEVNSQDSYGCLLQSLTSLPGDTMSSWWALQVIDSQTYMQAMHTST